jgi:hypothetical protein
MTHVRNSQHSPNVRQDEQPHAGTTHAHGCHAWGRQHYECAIARIKELEQLAMRQAAMIRKLQAAEHEAFIEKFGL